MQGVIATFTFVNLRLLEALAQADTVQNFCGRFLSVRSVDAAARYTWGDLETLVPTLKTRLPMVIMNRLLLRVVAGPNVTIFESWT